MKTRTFIVIFLLFLGSCINPKTNQIVAVIDGDTYDILLNGNKKVRVRMEGIDAPEKGMPYYRAAKNYLTKLTKDKIIHIDSTGKDRFGRLLAYTYLEDNTEVGHEMIKAGFAWHFKKYSSDTILAKLELQARAAKVGIWADEKPMPPWENRRLHKEGISTKDSFNIKENSR